MEAGGIKVSIIVKVVDSIVKRRDVEENIGEANLTEYVHNRREGLNFEGMLTCSWVYGLNLQINLLNIYE